MDGGFRRRRAPARELRRFSATVLVACERTQVYNLQLARRRAMSVFRRRWSTPRFVALSALVAVLAVPWIPSVPSVGGPPALTVPPHATAAASPTALHSPAVLGPPAWRPAPPAVPEGAALAGTVNPYNARTSEPAPMGIADYGLTGSGAGYSAYSYATPEWWADVNITKMLANDGSNASGHGSITFQLNVVVKFHSPTAGDVAYWIQDVASVDTIARTLGFVDNIWNMSSSSIFTSSVVGNGSVNSFMGLQWYADGPPCQGMPGGFVGNCVALHYPTHLTMRVTTGLFGGVPHVTFQYNDGPGGWVTYDNASFPFAAGYTDIGFVVDGSQYTPIGIYYNAEFVYTGPGGPMFDRNTAMHLQLQYWNGHNLQSPSNAFNFGANTAEQISNVLATPLFGPVNGSLASNVTTGAGGLGTLYYRSNVSILNVTSPEVGAGTLVIAGVGHDFVGHEALVTLAPGRYELILENASGVVNSANVTLSPGEYLHLTLGVPTAYPITLVERGLPTGAGWTVHIAAQEFHLRSPSVLVNLTNGSYAWSVDPVAGFSTTPYSGSIPVRGAALTFWINFTQVIYTITFSSTGLSPGQGWSVLFNGTEHASSADLISFTMPNGSYDFAVSAGPLFVADPPSGTLQIAGSPQTILISWSLRPGYLSGSVSPANATLVVSGTTINLSAGEFNVSLPPGLYDVQVTRSGYAPYEQNLTLTAGNVTTITVTLRALPPSGGGNPGGTGGLSGTTTLLLVVVVAVAAAAVVVAAATVRGRRRR